MNITEDENSEFEKIAPKLASMKRDLPFSVPEGYFDEFPTRVQSHIATKKQSGLANSFIRLLEKRRWVPVAFASCIALIFSLILIFTNTNKNELAIGKGNKQIETPKQEELAQEKAAFEETILDEVDEDNLINEVENKESLAQLPAGVTKKENKNTEVGEKQELENYIMDNFEESDLL